ncbi:hypothetical protein BJ138DRAFT_1017321, partial [Hygrophoropsis aurantiaca]
MGKTNGPATRREEYLKNARNLLENWRDKTWVGQYSHVPYGPEGLLPNQVVQKIASSTRIKTIEDMVGVGWSTSRAERHGEEVLKLLEAYDTKYQRMREAEKEAKAEAKRAATEQRKA